jgi:hypothetical protein
MAIIREYMAKASPPEIVAPVIHLNGVGGAVVLCTDSKGSFIIISLF